MQISDKMDQELERLARNGILQVATRLDPLTEQIRSVTYSPEDVHILLAFPSLRTREGAQLRRMIGDGVHVVHRCGPRFFPLYIVGPGCDGSEGT